MLFCNSMIFLSSLLTKSFNKLCENIDSICFNSLTLSEIFKPFIALSCSFVCFSKALPRRE